jgi:hypothetical protein
MDYSKIIPIAIRSLLPLAIKELFLTPLVLCMRKSNVPTPPRTRDVIVKFLDVFILFLIIFLIIFPLIKNVKPKVYNNIVSILRNNYAADP